MATPYDAIRDGFYCRAHKEMYDDEGKCEKCILGAPEWKETIEKSGLPTALDLPLATMIWRVLIVSGAVMLIWTLMTMVAKG